MNLVEFIRESNRIEGIHRDPTEAEIKALDDFLQLEVLSVLDLQEFVAINQPGAVIRERVGLDVRVGPHLPPRGGPQIVDELTVLLADADNPIDWTPWQIHVRYESLHPFTDGNGRSGRAVWAWMMWQRRQGIVNSSFLHTFYYQTLQESR